MLPFLPTLLYVLALGAAGGDLAADRRALRVAVLVLVTAGLIARIATFLSPGLCPVSGAGGGLGMVAIFLALHVVFGFRPEGSERARVFVALFVVAALDLTGQLVGSISSEVRPERAERIWGEVHGGLMLLSYAAFLIAGVYSLLYVLLYRVMKTRRVGFWFDRLPSLQRLESKTGVAVAVGLGSLTLGLLVGLFTFASFSGGVPVDVKVLVAGLLWLLFLGFFVGRRLLRVGGIRVMWVPLVGAGVILCLYSIGGSDHPFWSPA